MVWRGVDHRNRLRGNFGKTPDGKMAMERCGGGRAEKQGAVTLPV